MVRSVGLYAIAFFLVITVAGGQRTHPDEARAINAIFSRWGISDRSVSQGWNTTGDPCSGKAIDPNFDYDNYATYNPGLTCDCNFPNSTCHITRLRVYELDVQGNIPDELWTLVYLTDLNLGRNYLTGPLPPAIGNLTRMQWLTFGINALSGELPRELGLLTDLRSLGFGTNNFTGPLPSELGNCKRLQQLYMDSSGVSGVIPSTFANLQNLETVWASDIQLTGRIPDFIGNWSQLQSLRFQGNSFEGPIPRSFSNLASLADLRISDLYGTSSFEFLANLKSLSVLILRNNNISGTIPSNIGEYQNLRLIDLSFNNLSGQIPGALFNLRQLTFMFLGSNSLTGNLPASKSSSLLNIDLSYNGLSGLFPTWVNDPRLQVNLVANKFAVGNSNTSVLPSGLNCLQRDFPCNRGSPKYYNFAINSGGREVTASNRLVYERDNETLGPMAYYVTSTGRWAVSNIGLRDNPEYTAFSARPFTNTLDSDLFQTSRLSAGSLRYYGLGLENGYYTVNLQFAELVFEEGRTSRGLGRRVFDIYIQGNLVWKDFDIRREAGGQSFRPVSKQFTALVSENYLEIHLFWAGKGTCCVPIRGTYGPSISAINATPKFIPATGDKPPSKDRTGLIAGIVVPVAVVIFVALLALLVFVRRRQKRLLFEEDEGQNDLRFSPFLGRRNSYMESLCCTKNCAVWPSDRRSDIFSSENLTINSDKDP